MEKVLCGFIFCTILMGLISMTACDSVLENSSGIHTTRNSFGLQASSKQSAESDTEGQPYFATIQCDAFTLRVPDDWNTETKPEVVFKKKNQVIGGVFEMSYDATQPLSQFYGNHAEEISKKEIKTFSFPAMEVILRRSSPAAASEQSSVDELHYYFIKKDSKVVYDLNFNLAFVDNETAKEIAQTFKIK